MTWGGIEKRWGGFKVTNNNTRDAASKNYVGSVLISRRILNLPKSYA